MTSIALMFRDRGEIQTSSMLRGGISVQVRLHSVKPITTVVLLVSLPILLRRQMGVCYRPE